MHAGTRKVLLLYVCVYVTYKARMIAHVRKFVSKNNFKKAEIENENDFIAILFLFLCVFAGQAQADNYYVRRI